MKFPFICFLIVMFFSSEKVRSQNNPDLIKILSYNIYHDEDTYLTGKSNLEDIANLILQIQPDVIALQEIDSMTLRSIAIYGERVNLIAEFINRTGYKRLFRQSDGL